MQRFKCLQPRMGTAAGLSVFVLGLCLGQSCTAAKEPLPQLLEQKPAVSALAMDALPNRIVVTIKGDPRTSRGFSWFMNPENRGIYTQSDSPKKSSRNIWSLAVVSVDQRY